MKAILQVTGMTCDHCAKRVTKALQGVAGVRSVTVSLEGERAEVEHTGTISPEGLVQAVVQAGYQAKVLSLESA